VSWSRPGTSAHEQKQTRYPPLPNAVHRNYIGDQAGPKPNSIQVWLKEQLGLEDEVMLLNVVVNKIVSNLRYWVARCAPRTFPIAFFSSSFSSSACPD
jgi:hypothetical protein